MSEAERILREYDRRARELPADRYSLARPGVLFAYQQRVRAALGALGRHGIFPLAGRRILEVGCGSAGWLVDFEAWGAARRDLCAIELAPDRARIAAERLPGADVRTGDASALPWPDGAFDLVLQSTVFTSILDPAMKRAVAAEMTRVLAPGGAVLWYDFFRDNPWNRQVKGVPAAEIRALFPGFAVELERTTLAPPIARRVTPVTWLGALLLEKLEVLNTHYLGVLRRRP